MFQRLATASPIPKPYTLKHGRHDISKLTCAFEAFGDVALVLQRKAAATTSQALSFRLQTQSPTVGESVFEDFRLRGLGSPSRNLQSSAPQIPPPPPSSSEVTRHPELHIADPERPGQLLDRRIGYLREKADIRLKKVEDVLLLLLLLLL